MEASPQELEGALEADRVALRLSLAAALRRPEIREALFLASPDLEEVLDEYLKGGLTQDKRTRIDHSLVRYLSRMAFRPTPFGLFAGCSTGAIGDLTRLKMGSISQTERHSRLDNDYLSLLCEAIEKEYGFRLGLKYRPNSSMTRAAGRLHFAEARINVKKWRSYHLVAVDASDYLALTLERSRNGATISELSSALVTDEITLEEATQFIHDLIDNQVLVSDLSPNVTGKEPIHHILDRLECHQSTGSVAVCLAGIRDRIQTLDRKGLGVVPAEYRSIAEGLKGLPVKVNLKHLFQVDLVKPAPQASLGQDVIRAFEDGVLLLQRLQPPDSDDIFETFKKAFRSRYESRWMPLSLVLDREAGIGFLKRSGICSDASPLLEGLQFQRSPGTGRDFSSRDVFLFRKLKELGDSIEWELSTEDLAALENPHPTPLVDALSVVGVLAAPSLEDLDQGRFQLNIRGFNGPSGGRLLGRFCHADPRLRFFVEEHQKAEEALDPDAIYAEIVHLPEGRMGNFLCRPMLRAYEIPYLGHGAADVEHQIPISDLEVCIINERVVLRSKKLGKRVVPRLTTAQNYSIGLSTYRFLCYLQDQDRGIGGWQWGAAESSSFLPRVCFQKWVLARARWQVDIKELKPILDVSGSDQYIAFKAWQAKRKIARFVVLADGDNELLLDLDQVLWIETFLHLISKRSRFQLVEHWPGRNQLLAMSPDGSFTHEIVIPLVRAANDPGKKPADSPLSITSITSPVEDRSFPPGSEWLYAKFFANTATADQILLHGVAPLLENILKEGLVDRWFFLRYEDPDHQLRLRLHGNPAVMEQEVLPRLHRLFAQLQSQGLAWKCVLDTYEREIERYGGQEGMALAEEFFTLDSEAILRLLQTYHGDASVDLRWQMGFKAVDSLLDDFGFDLETKYRVIQGPLKSFRLELKVESGLEIQIGEKFRKLRMGLDSLLFPSGSVDEIVQPGLAILAHRSERLKPLCISLKAAEKNGHLSASREAIVMSYNHMHLNRLLRDNQRAQEFIIYEFLSRVYKSRLAREKRRKSV